MSDAMTLKSASDELNWLLEELVQGLAGAEHAVLLSADGLLMGRSSRLSSDDAEHLSAVCSGLQSLAKGASRHFDGGPVRQTVVEMDRSILLVTAAGRGACLALLAAAEADLGMVAYEMNLMVKRVGAYLASRPRDAANWAAVDPDA